MIDRETWEQDVQHFEAGWWGDCANTYGEETKQRRAYAPVMGLSPGEWHGGDAWPRWDMRGKTILDVGGGPVSMTLKMTGFASAVVVDPCAYPDWVDARYAAHNVAFVQRPAEDYLPTIPTRSYDEALIYNVLQHTLDPLMILREMKRVARVVRLFEWIDTPPHAGHPHELHAGDLAKVLGVRDRPERHVWFDEQYRRIAVDSDSPIRQSAWGGAFR